MNTETTTKESTAKKPRKRTVTAPAATPAPAKKNTVTTDMIAAKIESEKYVRIPGTTVTVCGLILKNGFVAIGTSACVDPENFDAKIGKQLAREQAVEKVWALEGYLLAERLAARRKK